MIIKRFFALFQNSDFKTMIINYYKKLNHISNVKKDNPILFWKLNNHIKRKHIQQIITLFYVKIFQDTSDENKWFIDEFRSSGSLFHHIDRQVLFWQVMFGFKNAIKYKGGLKKLNNHHSLSKQIMTERGANLWIHYMNESLLEYKDILDEIHSDIFACIQDFVCFAMHLYAMRFGFTFKYNERFSQSKL